MQVPQFLNNINSSSILESIAGSNYILPFLGLFFVRFFLFRFISGSLGLLLILAAVFLIFSSDPALSSQLSGFGSFGNVGYTSNAEPSNLIFGQNPYLLAGILFLIIFFFRPRGSFLPYMLLFSLIGYLLFSRDFRPATLIAEGSWKTSLAAGGLLLIVLLFLRRRNRYFYSGPMNLSWVQPTLLFLAMIFAALVIKNPAWLEAQLPGWKSSIGFGVIAASCVGFFYNLPIKFRPYAISACWLFIVITVSKAMGLLAF